MTTGKSTSWSGYMDITCACIAPQATTVGLRDGKTVEAMVCHTCNRIDCCPEMPELVGFRVASAVFYDELEAPAGL